MVEVNAGTIWSARGKSLETTGPALGKELPPVLVHEGPWLQVIHDWYPETTLHIVGPGDFAVIAQKEPPVPQPASRSARRRSRR